MPQRMFDCSTSLSNINNKCEIVSFMTTTEFVQYLERSLFEIDGNFSSANGGCFPRKMRNHQDFFGGWAFVSSQDPFFITGVETLRHCSLLDHN